MTSVLVIGAGIGGITTAARLAQQGFQVTVLEKCGQPGGRCGRLVQDGHVFDTGSTLFLMPEFYTRTFTELGERIEDHLDLIRVDPTYHIHFHDGATLALTSDLNAMQAQLEAIEPGSFGGFLRYLNEGYHHYKLSIPNFVDRDFRSLFEFLSPKNLLLFLRLKVLEKHYDRMSKYFRDPRLKIAFTFQNMYMGLSPYEAPAIFSLMQYSEFADGIWFPMGGMYSVIEALTEIAEKRGVTFQYDSPVTQIEVDGRMATGVTLDGGRKLQADIVVANSDLPYVYKELLPDDGTTSRLERKKYGCSTLMFYWGVDKQYPQLGPHNLFFAENLRQSFAPIFEDSAIPNDPHFYVYAPTRVDPSLAPDGQDTLVVAIPVGCVSDLEPKDWTPTLRQMRKAVLQRLNEIGITDLGDHIKFEMNCTPHDWHRRFNLVKGSTHGLSHNLMQLGYFRPQNRHNRYRNLYFVGSSTHPGTGLPTVLVSARLVTERILQEAKVPQTAPIKTPLAISSD
ncbi:MAG: phytoene desaturase [Anaerolineaceae bacterium]|nr:MAG: phytoene desaturase [Anaerolineaceae bacterium]